MNRATFTIDKSLTIIAPISATLTMIDTVKYSEFTDSAKKYNEITLHAPATKLSKWNKYKNILLSLGFTELSCQYFHTNVYDIADVISSRTTFVK